MYLLLSHADSSYYCIISTCCCIRLVVAAAVSYIYCCLMLAAVAALSYLPAAVSDWPCCIYLLLYQPGGGQALILYPQVESLRSSQGSSVWTGSFNLEPSPPPSPPPSPLPTLMMGIDSDKSQLSSFPLQLYGYCSHQTGPGLKWVQRSPQLLTTLLSYPVGEYTPGIILTSLEIAFSKPHPSILLSVADPPSRFVLTVLLQDIKLTIPGWGGKNSIAPRVTAQ
jgi:hypothetical protein